MTFKAALLAGTALAFVGGAAIAGGTHPVTGEALADNQTFTYRVLDEFPSIDPNLIEDVEGSAVGRNLFEGLLSQDAEGNVVPGVATSYEASEDGLTYTFHLRPEAKWSDGRPVTAGDFVYSWRRAADPATASEYQWYMGLMALENVEEVMAGEMPPDQLGVTAIDDQTLEVRLHTALPYFPQMVVHTTTFPVPAWAIEEWGDTWTQPGHMVSNGAYVLAERVPQEKIVLTRNDQYWDNANTIIDTVTAMIINDENAALTRYQAGELDKTDVPAGQYPALHEQFPTEAVSVPNLCTYYYNINLTETGVPALQDVRVREALALAIDRDVIVNNVLAGGQVPAYSLTHWAIAGWEVPSVDYATWTQAERDERARQLMAEAGYGPDGEALSLEILFNTSEAHNSIAVAIGQMWKQKLGVDTTLANQEWQTFLTARGEQDYQVARAGWCADYNEASSFLDIMQSESGYNDSKYSNPEYDAAMLEARTAADPMIDYQEAEALIMRDFPIIPLYFYASVFMLDDAMKGWPFESAQQNWYARTLYRVAE
ncbi:MAG: peptide ABC transporter substrate-binding protein [Rubellimicrobium sp.]|nr:peptide ABC transporter substrate-binding protein [Rubellimicrobium sp.]